MEKIFPPNLKREPRSSRDPEADLYAAFLDEILDSMRRLEKRKEESGRLQRK
ncbi:hypothetical protein SAMN04488523_1056 [Sulfitobacter brevis]|uniref:Uncharacterized protein n=1 Tax=Sulfitobacter brevis TaxID=74348 RepID=A0A1I1XWE5_9RHOB|nr:hypothetical protein [Sulfitobacter brevis]SFE10213.1 hypothetical protein SAMN04488523_1056 [Sulfitobacter brevis]